MIESKEEESNPSKNNMQMELHSKGLVLTKAWSDLFSFITKYQAELTAKENAVGIAEREIDVRKKQLEETRPVAEYGNYEISRLQDEIRMKEHLLLKSQSDISEKDEKLQMMQSELICHKELLEKDRCDMLERQTEKVCDPSDLEHLKSELLLKQEQIRIKDSLIVKLENELMRENAELKEQLDVERQTLEFERRSHEMTKKCLREKSVSLPK
jgi:chromosome segregation ATPase